MVPRSATPRPGSRCAVSTPEGLIGCAIACKTAVYQGAAAEHQHQIAKRATQAIEYQGATSDEGEPTFEISNVDMMVSGHVVLGCPRLQRPRIVSAYSDIGCFPSLYCLCAALLGISRRLRRQRPTRWYLP